MSFSSSNAPGKDSTHNAKGTRAARHRACRSLCGQKPKHIIHHFSFLTGVARLVEQIPPIPCQV